MRITVSLRRLMLMVACSVVAGPAAAQTGIVDQVEALGAETGETSVEIQTVWVPRQNGEDAYLAGAITIDHALRPWAVVGTELSYDADGRLSLDEILAQIKLTAIDPADAPVGLGVQIAAGYSIGEDDLAVEAIFIAAVERETWSGAANLEIEARDGGLTRYDVRYAVRVDYALATHWAIGIETGGELASEAARGHWVGPVLTVAGDDGGLLPELELSAFSGLNRASPDMQLRIELEWGF